MKLLFSCHGTGGASPTLVPGFVGTGTGTGTGVFCMVITGVSTGGTNVRGTCDTGGASVGIGTV